MNEKLEAQVDFHEGVRYFSIEFDDDTCISICMQHLRGLNKGTNGEV